MCRVAHRGPPRSGRAGPDLRGPSVGPDRGVARASGAEARLIEEAENIDPVWLDSATSVGVTAGASTPDSVVDEVIRWLMERSYHVVEEVEIVKEAVHFTLPAELKRALPV